MYLAVLEPTHSPSTIRRLLAAISVSHQLVGMETPTADAGVKSVWAGIRRRNGVAPRKVRAARTKLITTLVEPLGNKLIDVRDRALILVGFAGALRRSELVALDVDDIDEDADGLVLRIRNQKPTRRPQAKPEVSPIVRIPPRAQCGRGALGPTLQASTQVLPSELLIDTNG